MRGKIRIYSIIFCLGFTFILWSGVPVADVTNCGIRSILAGVEHDPIVIDGDENFIETASNEDWSGDGSEDDPFIIDDYDIDLGGASGHCIDISNTQVYFTISNCYLTGAGINPGAGIYLNNVTNGDIIDNTILKNYNGIYFVESDDNTVVNNSCNDINGYGIYLYDSNSNFIANNTDIYCSYGIFLESSYFNILTSNICYGDYRGIELEMSDSNILNNNTCYSNTHSGIYLYISSDSNTLTDNTCYSTTNGIYVFMSVSNVLINNTCYENDESGIYLNNSNHTTLRKNFCYNNDLHGIYLEKSESNTITDNTCNLNIWCGIILAYSNFSTLTNNVCYDNIYGVYLGGSIHNILVNNTAYSNSESGFYLIIAHFNTLTDNTGYDNDFYGINVEYCSFNMLTDNTLYENNAWGINLLTSTCNIVTKNLFYDNTGGVSFYDTTDNDCTWNVFLDNGINAYDEFPYHIPNTFVYNYWLDYNGYDVDGDGFGEWPYSFTDNSDPHPLVYIPTSPTLVETPRDVILELGFSSFHLKLNATCPTFMTWWVNNSLFNIDNQGELISGILPIGEYPLTVVVSDIYGFGTSVSFTVIVVDTTTPSWVIIPIDQEVEYGRRVIYQVAATDLSGIDYWTVSDSVNFEIDEFGVITNSTILSPGSYPLVVTVYDPHGNNLSEAITISVNEPEDTTPPAWVTLTIHQSFDYGELVQIQIEAWDESGIDNLWLNDTVHFTINDEGMITNTLILEPGIYNLEVRAYDPNDNFCSAAIVVTVLESEVIPTTTDTITSSLEDMNPVVTLTLGIGIGGAAVLIIIVAFLKRGSEK